MQSETSTTAREIILLRDRHIRNIREGFPNTRAALRLLDELYQQPIINVKTVQDALEISRMSANTLVGRFVQSGILKQISEGRRYRIFSYEPYLSLFSD